MNLGTIWDKLDETDRILLDMLLSKSADFDHDFYKKSATYHKMIFVNLSYVLNALDMNVTCCLDNDLYSNIDNELQRTYKIIHLIDELEENFRHESRHNLE